MVVVIKYMLGYSKVKVSKISHPFFPAHKEHPQFLNFLDLSSILGMILLVANHLENLERIFTFILRDTRALRLVDILADRVSFFVEKHITLRDAENFMAYYEYLMSTSKERKPLKFEPKLIQSFINRTYADLETATQEFRAKKLYEYLENKLGVGEIGEEDMQLMKVIVHQERMPTLDKLQERIRTAMILKWLQGPVKDRLGKGLQDYIVFLATVYGQYQTGGVFDVDWQPYDVPEADTNVIEKEFEVFKLALINVIKRIKAARGKDGSADEGNEQFIFILDSIDHLIEHQEKKSLNSVEAFTDKLVVSSFLIYVQDEFVKKDEDLQKFIQLAVSLYYQFRDEQNRYAFRVRK
jgi:hypothetical protein